MIPRAAAAVRRHPAWPVLRLLWTVSRAGTVGFGALLVVSGLLPVAFMVSVGQLLGAVAALGSDPGAAHRAWLAFAAIVAVWLVDQFVDAGKAVLNGWLGRLVTVRTTDLVMAACLRPVGVAHLEDPAAADRISQAQGVGGGTYPPASAVGALSRLLGVRLQAVGAAVTLAVVLWWAPLPLAVAWVVVGGYLAAVVRRQVQAIEQQTGTLRRSNYLRKLGTGAAAAKEVRVFGLADWLVEQFTAQWRAGMAELFRRQPGAAGGMVVRVGLLVAAHALPLAVLAAAAVDGTLSVVALTIAAQAVVAMSAFGPVGDLQWLLTGSASSIRHAMELAATTPTDPPADPSADPSVGPSVGPSRVTVSTWPELAAMGLPRDGIRFEGVSFGYPGRDARARPLDGLDLWIPAGQSLAIVGENGAGKTTIVKLLARLYEADAGRITVDGTDLGDLDLAAWRRQLAVVFQDFVRYELSARDNVAFGRVDAPVRLSRLAVAADQAGADELVAELADGWDTVLSRQFGGAELSGGQWQRMALARALYAVSHGARVLVLDEPTAHLDARAESRLYERFLELTRGLTTVLVSHRFNTVRLADRIAVLHGGRVTEYGGHDELMARDGRYAAMFRMQAERFEVR